MIKKLILPIIVAIVTISNIQAQDSTNTSSPKKELKIGYANVEYIMSKWPEISDAQESLKTYEMQLQKKMQLLQQDYQETYAQIMADQEKMTDIELKEAEQNLKTKMAQLQFQENISTEKLQDKFNTVMQPLLDKILTKIQEVGKEEGYTYVINQQSSSTQTLILLYSNNEDDNISNKVLKKLGVVAPTTNTQGGE